MILGAALRVKNESRWIGEVVGNLTKASLPVWVFDDHSTDDTAKIAKEAGAKIIPSPYNSLNEARDKRYLIEHITQDPDKPLWMLMIDGDELLTTEQAEYMAEHVYKQPPCVYDAKIWYLWDSPNQLRIDGIYGRFYRPSLFPLLPSASAHFATNSKVGFHCSNVPAYALKLERRHHPLFYVKHFGYMDRETRLRKYAWYNQTDPNNLAEDCYRHVIQGDPGGPPANQKLLHAGPLQLAHLEEFSAWKAKAHTHFPNESKGQL